MNRMLFVIGVILLSSCGGGEGDNSSAIDFSGQYVSNMSTFEDTCNNPPALGSWSDTFTVTQSGSSLEVTSTSGITLPAEIDNSTGFTAINDGDISCAGGGTQHSQLFLTFSNVSGDSAVVELDRGLGECSTQGGLSCSYRARGTATRYH